MKYCPNLSTTLIIALILRLLWVILIPVVPISDSAAYDTFATNIWLHGTYGWEPDAPYSYWPVGTSAIYSAFYSVFGHSYLPIALLNCALSLGIIYFSYHLTRRFFSDNRLPECVALLLALWPTGIMFVTVLGSELLYMFFSLAGMHLFFKPSRSPGNWGATILISLGVGVLFAAAYYIRPLITVPFAICIFVALFHQKMPYTTVIGRSLIVASIIALAVAPWAYRNYQLHDAFVPMSTNSGAVFWMGNQPGTSGGYLPTPPEMHDMDTHLRSQILKQQAMDYIKEEPVAFVTRTLYKFFKFHSYETIGVTWNAKGIEQRFGEGLILPLKLLTQAYWLLIVITAWLGILIYLFREGFMAVVLNPFTLMWASSAGIHSLIVSQDRYHIPSVPFLMAFSLYFALLAWEKYSARS